MGSGSRKERFLWVRWRAVDGERRTQQYVSVGVGDGVMTCGRGQKRDAEFRMAVVGWC